MAARKSNPEFIADLMRYASAGPLMQAFVIESLDRYAAPLGEQPANNPRRSNRPRAGLGDLRRRFSGMFQKYYGRRPDMSPRWDRFFYCLNA